MWYRHWGIGQWSTVQKFTVPKTNQQNSCTVHYWQIPNAYDMWPYVKLIEIGTIISFLTLYILHTVFYSILETLVISSEDVRR